MIFEQQMDLLKKENKPEWTRPNFPDVTQIKQVAIDLETYDIPYPRDVPLSTQVIIHLDKFIDCPYYLTNRSIVVTNEKKAVELTLFSGDLRKYGLTKAINRQKNS